MSTAGLFPWLQLERQTKTPGVGTPAQDLVKSLINIQERRDQTERLKRQEERQARIDALNEEELRRNQALQDYETQAKIAAQTKGYEEVLKNLPTMIGNIENPQGPPAEREKVTTKTGPDGSQTVSVDRPLLPNDPELGVPVDTNPEVAAQLQAPDLSNLDIGNPQMRGIPEVLPLIREMQQVVREKRAPMTADLSALGIDKPVELPYMEDALRQKRLETLAGPVGVQYEMYSSMRESPEERLAREIAVANAKQKSPERLKEEALAKFEAEKEVFGPRRRGSSGAEGGQFLFNTETEEPEYVRDSVLASSPPTKYRKVYASDVKADTRRGSIMEIFGGPESNDPASLWNAALAMNKGKTGGFGRIVGGAKTAYKTFSGEEPLTRNYQKQLAGFSSMIAKEFGESGRLSDQDIQRTMNLFPTPTDTEEETLIALTNIWRVLNYGKGKGSRPVDVLGEVDDTHTFSRPRGAPEEFLDLPSVLPPPPPGNWENVGGE